MKIANWKIRISTSLNCLLAGAWVVTGLWFGAGHASAQSAGPDVVQLVASESDLEQVDPQELPPFGTFWLVAPGGPNGCLAVPLPTPPIGLSPTFQVADGQFIVDGVMGEIVNEQTAQAQAASVAALINQIQAAQVARPMPKVAMESPDLPSSGDSQTNSNTYFLNPNLLYLQITNVSDGLACMNLYNATNQIYAIYETTNLLTPLSTWDVVAEVLPTDTNCTPFTVPTLNQDSLFLRAEDWTGVTENGNITPDWWFWMFFGTTALLDTNLDSGGVNTLLYDYTNGLDPNTIQFSIEVSDNYVSTSSVLAQLVVSGTPFYIAISVDDTNYAADAVWNEYTSPCVTVPLGTTQGWHSVWIGLRGHADSPTAAVWQWKRLKFDVSPPLVVITGPTNSIVNVPIIQLTGYSPEALASISYDLNNAAGLVTNQQIMVTDESYATNTWEFTTNWFQCFDVPITTGANVFTIQATDLAGNVTTTNFTITLDYSDKTNPPVVEVDWPQNGATLSGTNFNLTGQLADPTASVSAQVVSTDGNTNVVTGAVGRDGKFWMQNLPLNSGTNIATLTVQDVLGNTTTTNLTLIQSAVVLTIDPVVAGQITVTGTINTSGYTVWVNGIQATNTGGGGWTVQIPPITIGGGTVNAVAIPNGGGQ